MKEIKFDLIDEICEEQDFDELLLRILNCNKQKRINQILQDIEENNDFDAETKKKLYEEIFEYANFSYGFKLGTMLAFEIFSEKENQ